MPKKKYSLHCFRCGQLIFSKEDAKRNRINGVPYCGECAADFYGQDQALFEEEQFYKEFPTDQDYIDYKHRQKYGEY